MNQVDFIVVLFVFAFIGLAGVSIVNARQTRARLVSQKITQLKRRISELDEISLGIESLVTTTTPSRVVLEELYDTIQGMVQLDHDNQSLQTALSTAKKRLSEIKTRSKPDILYRLMASDASIAKAQYQISEAARIIRKRQATGRVEISEMNNLIGELSWANLMIVVITLTGQGHKAVRSGEVLKACAFYKKAQQAAMESTLGDERRHQFVRELTEILSNKRKNLSLQLMPETEFNVSESENTPALTLTAPDEVELPPVQ
ncbi:MAG: hypothetical protein ACI93R_002819 [Flavobacteriales bacterium]|jgi:hypothetical protein